MILGFHSILAADFSEPTNSACAKHFPDLFHSKQISFKRAIELASSHPFSGSCFSAFNSLTCHDFSTSRCRKFTTSLKDGFNPWLLLQNSPLSGNSRPLSFVVHGSAGGGLDPSLVEFAAELSSDRESQVQVEALTADTTPCLSSQATWLVPLLLLPGKHARSEFDQKENRYIVSSKTTLSLASELNK